MKMRKSIRFALAMLLMMCGVIVAGAFKTKAATVAPDTVANGMLDVRMQITEPVYNEAKKRDTYSMRLVSSVNGLGYANTGFEIYFDANNDGDFEDSNEKQIYRTHKVTQRINAHKTGHTYKYSPKVIDTDSEYFVSVTLTNLNWAKRTNNFYVRAFTRDLEDGHMTYGEGRYFSVEEAVMNENQFNIPVKLTDDNYDIKKGDIVKVAVTDVDINNGYLTANTAKAYTQEAKVAQVLEETVYGKTDRYAHLYVTVPYDIDVREDVADTATIKTKRQNMASASRVIIEGTKTPEEATLNKEVATSSLTNKGSAIYRNLLSSYVYNGPDYTWYDVYYEEATTYNNPKYASNKFVIATNADLYGFSKLASDSSHTFASETIYEVCDIEVNKGTVTADMTTTAWSRDSFSGSESTKDKPVPWTPICNYETGSTGERAFRGTFDGQGHTISGLWSSRGQFVGLFSEIIGGTVKKLNLNNSYFCGTDNVVGSMAGRGYGTFEDVTCDAIIQCTNGANTYIGGFLGQTTSGTSITNCEFSGSLTAVSGRVGGFVGLVWGATTVDNCVNNATLTVDTLMACGGILGDVDVASAVSLNKCVNNGTIRTQQNSDADTYGTGGLVGVAKSTGNLTIKECLNTGHVSSGNRNIGGLIGLVDGRPVTLQNCQNSADIGTLTDPKGYAVGGIIGYITAACTNTKVVTMKYCLNTGTISSDIAWNSGMIGRLGGCVDIQNSLNSGSLVYKSANLAYGSIVGHLNAGANLTVKSTYAADGYDRQIYTGGTCTINGTEHTSANTTATGIHSYTAHRMKGFLGFQNGSELDWTDYWVPVLDETPQLKSFTTGTALDLKYYEEKLPKDQDVYIITTAEELYSVAELSYLYPFYFSNKVVQLGADIVLNDGTASSTGFTMTDTTKQPEQWLPIYEFSGTFDGNGYSISGLYLDTTEQGIGLFKQTNTGSVVKDLKLTNSYINSTNATNYAWVGSIAGTGNGTFDRVYSDAFVNSTGAMCGGLVGNMTAKAVFNECCFDGRVATTHEAGYVAGIGGILGYAGTEGTTTAQGAFAVIEGEINHCLVTGIVSSKGAFVGGMIGWCNSPEFKVMDSLTAGTIDTAEKNTVGSIVGRVQRSGYTTYNNEITFENTYATSASCSKGYFNEGVLHGDVKTVGDLTGTNGYANSTLDFTNYWTAVSGDTPQLQAFYTGASLDVSGVTRNITVGTADTAWYTGDRDEYVINTAEQLYGFAQLGNEGNMFSGVTIKLGADIMLNDGDNATWASEAPTNVWTPIGDFAAVTDAKEFRGIFDGQGHSISGVYYKGTSNFVGFFGATAVATVKNLKLENCYFETTGFPMGGVVGRASGSTFEKIHVDAILTSSVGQVGGIVGQATAENDLSGTVGIVMRECYFEGSVSTTNDGADTDITLGTGGLLGHTAADNVTYEISSCYNKGTISENKEGHVGGIIGFLDRGIATISNCLNTGTVTTNRNDAPVLGSIVGRVLQGSNLTTTNVYATTESCSQGLFVTLGSSSTYAVVNGEEIKSQGDVASAVTKVASADLTGTVAQTNAPNLDWENCWMTTDVLPELDIKMDTSNPGGPLKVLLIGNSFCYYWVEELYGLADAAGIEMEIYNVYSSGCQLPTHWNWYETYRNNYSIYCTDQAGRRLVLSAQTLVDGMGLEDWDVISMQTGSISKYSSKEAFLTAEWGAEGAAFKNMYNLLTGKFPKARMVWHRTWEYEYDETVSNYDTQKFVATRELQKALYSQHEEFKQTYVKEYFSDDNIVPTGNAWEAFRTDYGRGLTGSLNNVHSAYLNASNKTEMGNKYGDFYHDGDIGGGQYLNACVWFEVLTGKSVLGNTYRPSYTFNTYQPLNPENASTQALDTGDKLATQLQKYAHEAVEAYCK